jgi:hypothetical protein
VTTDPLSPEDRALHDAFFEAYRVKFIELAAAAGGGEVSLDACTVGAIRAMVDQEIERRYRTQDVVSVIHLGKPVKFNMRVKARIG